MIRTREKIPWWLRLGVGGFFAYAILQNMRAPAEVSSDATAPNLETVMLSELRAEVGDARLEEVQARLKQKPELAGLGTRRFSPGELDQLNGLRLHMLQTSADLCQSVWSGKDDMPAATRALRMLSVREQRQWARLMARAVLLEIDDAPAPERELVPQEAIEQVASLLSAKQREAFSKAFDPARETTAVEGCIAMRQLMEHAPSLEPVLRERTLRALAGR